MHKIKKAIIPLAGLATRMYPISRTTKKAFLPIIDTDGRIKPLIYKLVEELHYSGIEEICLIIGKNEESLYQQIFSNIKEDIYCKISEEDREYEQLLNLISKKIKYIVQEKTLGFGHAVYLAKKYMNDEPCILVLGDTIYKSKEDNTCIEQMLNYYDEVECTIIGLHEINEDLLKYYGTSYGKWDDLQKNKLSIENLVEKPTKEYAQNNLLLDGKYYGNFGIFILTKEVFNELEEIVSIPLQDKKEYQLMDAFQKVIKSKQVKGLVINGTSFDMGNIEGYKNVMRNF